MELAIHVENLLHRVLSPVEKIVLEACEKDVGYDKVPGYRDFNASTVRSSASSLYRLIEEALGTTGVSKRNLGELLKQHLEASGIFAISPYLFFGRSQEVAWLDTMLPHQQCLVIYGPAGIGKTALMSHYFQHSELSFQKNPVVWRSLEHRPPLIELLSGINLNRGTFSRGIDKSIDFQIQTFLAGIQDTQGVLVLDDAESLLYMPSREYFYFFQCWLKHSQRNRLILLTREQLLLVSSLGNGVQTNQLKGLEWTAAQEMYVHFQLVDSEAWFQLFVSHAGSPSQLRTLAVDISQHYDRRCDLFVQQNTTRVNVQIARVIRGQLNQLSSLQKALLDLFLKSQSLMLVEVCEQFPNISLLEVHQALEGMINLQFVEVLPQQGTFNSLRLRSNIRHLLQGSQIL